jgi:hypothetical protein
MTPTRLTESRRTNPRQLRLRSFLLIIIVIGGMIGLFVHSARRQRDVAASIVALGGTVRYRIELRPPRIGALWAVQKSVAGLVGADYVSSIMSVNLYSLPSESAFDLIESLDHVEELHVAGPLVNDSNLERITKLDRLTRLSLFESAITDVGLAHLSANARLRILSIRGANISDTGLRELQDLRGLQIIYLSGTKVTARGEKELARALPGLRIAH